VIPGDPAVAALGDYASKEAVDALRLRMGLDQPLLVQYGRFLGSLLRGDLGRSMITGSSVREQVGHALPYTIELTLVAILIGSGLGIPVGVYTAIRRNRLADYLGRILSLAGLSVPGASIPIGDSVTVEVVFGRPGLGKMMVGAILQRDYTALQSVMVVYTAFVVGINLLTDVVYGWVDPRIGRRG